MPNQTTEATEGAEDFDVPSVDSKAPSVEAGGGPASPAAQAKKAGKPGKAKAAEATPPSTAPAAPTVAPVASQPAPAAQAKKAEKFNPAADHQAPRITAQHLDEIREQRAEVMRGERIRIMARNDKDVRWLVQENARLSAELEKLKA